jgi:radical SAM protein with 4Fe4S-binding SPASM domain
MNVITPEWTILRNEDVAPDEKHRWVIDIPGLEGDSPTLSFHSRLRLYEDGTLLGPPYANHLVIRDRGRGRYSHWGTQLLFSSSDNTDPRTNGRQYSYRILAEGEDMLSMPSTMHVGITSACNLTCRICRTDEPYHGSTLSDADIDHLIEHAFPHLSELRLDVAGEPTLHRAKFQRLVSEATRHNVSVFMCTNAALMDQEMAEFICNSSMYKVQISFDSSDPGRLEWVRRGVKYEDLVRGIRYLVAARKAADRGDDLQFNMHAAILRNTIDDIPGLVRLAADLGVNEITTMFGFTHSYMDVDWSIFWDKAHYNDKSDEATALAAELGIAYGPWGKFDLTADLATRPPLVRENKVCRYVHQWAYVNPSGVIAPCCISPSHNLGILSLQPFEEIWRGPAYEELRKTQNTANPSNPKCNSCYIMMGWDKDSYAPYFDSAHWPEVRRRLGLPPE